jgi:putative drug exporter of the RND superfamily
MTQWLRQVGGRCADRALLVVAAWLVVVAGVSVLATTSGGRYSSRATLPDSEAQIAQEQLAAHVPSAVDESADVLLTSSGARATIAGVTAVQPRLLALRHVDPTQPLLPRWSNDHHTAWLHVRYDVPQSALGHDALPAIRAVASSVPGVRGYVTGSLIRDAPAPTGGMGEQIGIGIAVLVLLFAFGSVIAALMPVAAAAAAIITGLGLVKLLAHVYAINGSAPQLATMMGLGVGIDYSLFIVTRHREGLRAGLSAREAASAAAATAGSSVLWAGVTVVAAICGLTFAGIPVVSSLGFAAAIVVACSVAVALTLLPALLGLTGHHIDRLHIPLPHLRHERAPLDPSTATIKGPADDTLWTRWARSIERRPWPFVVMPVVALAVLAIPVAKLRLGEPDIGSTSHDSASYRGFAVMRDAFGAGANGPLDLVVTLPGSATMVRAPLHAAVAADHNVASVSPLHVSRDRRVAVMSVQPRTGPQDAATAALVSRLRSRVLPPVERATGAVVRVTGFVAGSHDVAQRVLHRLPVFIGVVLAMSFLLLMLVFRSILVPLKAVVLNLLSIGASLGVTVAVFTWGWLRQALGVAEPVPLESLVPMLMFAIVFGLSMDYEVILLSRVREEWSVGEGGRGSVVPGLTATARMISAAAAIMVAVFLAFTLSSDVVVKMIGLGLAVAIFLDATLIRLVLVPATMSLLGDLNWWLPKWLDRLLPHLDVEGAVPVTPYHHEPKTRVPHPSGSGSTAT